ncbi:TPA: hypothetical protein ACGBGA_002830 [Pseudomonas aeruginosa]
MLELFKDREVEYLQWVESNPAAYVANVDKAHSFPHYPVVHHASCSTLAGKENYTVGDYYKVCADTLEEVEQWSLREVGRPAHCCVVCSPIRWTGFWWVNHKQTARVELDGGYIWSPKKKKGGARNQAYINLTLVRPGDFVVSYAGGVIKAIGVAMARYAESQKPEGYGPAGENWNQAGWRVPVEWTLLDTPIRPKEHISEIAPLLPERYSPLQQSGDGNQGFYLSNISDELGAVVLRLAGARAATARQIAERVTCKTSGRLPVAQLRKVTAFHVWEAVRDLLEGVEVPDFGSPIKFELVTEDGERLPPKAVFGLAATRALGFAIKPKHFTAGVGSPCFQILMDAGFPIVPLGEKVAAPEAHILLEDQLWTEGNPKLATHLRRERATGLANAKKAKFREEHGELFCERCKLKPTEVYGELGDACIEVHHNATQVADMAAGHQTSLEDLQCLCANCHRVVHRLLKQGLVPHP